MPRIPFPDMAKLSGPKLEYVNEMGSRLINVVKMSLHTTDGLWTAQRDFMMAAVRKSGLTPIEREVLVLVVGFHSRSDYILLHHLSISRNLGMSEEVIEGIERGDYSLLEPKDQALARFVREVTMFIRPGDEVLAAVRKHFSDRQVLDMVTLIGNFMMTARVAAVTGAELDEKAIVAWAWDKEPTPT